MLQSAVFLARPPSGYMASARWPALVDMRRDQARSLSLAGVVVAVDDDIVYAMEGAPAALDDFLSLLVVSPCQAVTAEMWRAAVRFRFQRVLALSQPVLRPDEAAALRRALDPLRPAYADIPPLLGAAAMRWAMLPYRLPLRATTRLIAS
ncbi:hypothetical protein [Brevundimonas diminuta]|uniref:hypothetical protein n=1 Tax=Brevundimonas diminuta TaxID=293 RepID=UPI003D021CD8